MADAVYIREDTAVININVAGKDFNAPEAPGGSWSTYAGGGVEIDDDKTRPGGMGGSRSVGGPTTREDVTLTTQLTDLNFGWIRELENLLDRDATVGVKYMSRRTKAVLPGSGFTRTGTLKNVTPPDLDSNSNAATFISIVVSCDV